MKGTENFHSSGGFFADNGKGKRNGRRRRKEKEEGKRRVLLGVTAAPARQRQSLCCRRPGMMMNCGRLLRHNLVSKDVIGLVGWRSFSAGKAKKGSKGGGVDAPKASTLSKEVKSTTVVGANILKDGTDPKILPDSEYPDWLWHLLDKRTPLSELKRKNVETLPYEDLKRFVKLDNRARIKENNAIKAKN